MSQEQILKIIMQHKIMFASEIIEEVRIGTEACENVRQCLKQMRKYNDIGFILINCENKVKLAKQYDKVRIHVDKGMIRKPCYLYFHIQN